MNCSETMRLLDADLDGELDLVRHLEVAAHLESCAACARAAEAGRARSAALRESLTRRTAPPHLATRIRQSLPPARPFPPRQRSAWQWGGLAAALAACLVIGYGVGVRRAGAPDLVGEAIADHVRSLMAGHLTDVASTDQHTVKPWFAGKLDFSPPIVDLAGSGFPLAGGRLDELQHRPVAALVYRRRQHAINLFVWPGSAAAESARSRSARGYQTEAWTRNGFSFLAVSEIPADELAEFAREFQAHAP